MHTSPPLAATIESILHEREPNFLRLYLNPHVAQTCLCLDRYARTTWAGGRDEDFQSFLANGIEEAISGALKLLRCNRVPTDALPTGLILDPADRLEGFVSAELAAGGRVAFLPDLRVLGGDLDIASLATNASRIDPLVLVAARGRLFEEHAAAIRELIVRHEPTVVTCVDREALDTLRREPGRLLRQIVPDVVVFDESFVNHAVPFAAFTARRSMFAVWNRSGQWDVPLDDLPAQHNLGPAFHELSGPGRSRFLRPPRRGPSGPARRPDPPRQRLPAPLQPLAASAYPGRRVRDDRSSRLGLVRGGQRAAGLRRRGRGRLQHARA